MLTRIKKYVNSKSYRFAVNSDVFHMYDSLSDKEYIERKYNSVFEREIDFNYPTTFNQKLQILKLNNRNPEYTIMVDKYRVREFIANRIGEQYLIPLLGVWDFPNEIDFSSLPNRFAIKCNHNSGLGMCICTDKSKLDIKQVRKGLERGLKQDYYLTGREWPYKEVPRKIIAEQFLQSDEGGLTDYKIHCFNGEPKFILVCQNRFTESGLTEDFYTPEWEHMEVKRPKIPNAKSPIPKPAEIEEILELAKILSKDIPFLRVDFYIVKGKIYFSELTFYPASGFEGYDPPEWDETFGDWLILPK